MSRVLSGSFIWGAPWGSSGSFGVAGFIGVRHRGLRVLSGSLGSLGCALGVMGFDQVRGVHRGAPLGSLGSLGYIAVRPGCRSGSLGSF